MTTLQELRAEQEEWLAKGFELQKRLNHLHSELRESEWCVEEGIRPARSLRDIELDIDVTMTLIRTIPTTVGAIKLSVEIECERLTAEAIA